MRTLLFAITFIIFLPINLFGQADSQDTTESFVLTLKEKGTGRLLRKVETKFGSTVEYSDPTGTIVIPNFEDHKQIEFSRFGFEKLTIETKNYAGKSAATVYLHPLPPDDNEVRISGKKRPEVSRITISTEEAVKVAPGGDPVQVAKLLPGVQKGGGANRGADNRVVIRGSGPEDSKYFLDDIQVPIIFHTIGNLSIVPDQMIDEIEFSTGGFGPKYGDATGGVIVVKTKSTIPEKSSLEIKANFPIYAGLYYETPLSKEDGSEADSAISMSYRRSYIQYLLPMFLEQAPEKIDIDVVPFFGDIHLQYLNVTDSGYSKLNLFNSHDGLQLTGQIGVSEDESGSANISILNSFTTLSYQKFLKLPNKWRLTATPAISSVISDNDFLGNKIYFKTMFAALPFEFVKRISREEKIYVGASYLRAMIDLDLFVPQPTRDDPFIDFEEATKLKADEKIYTYEAATWISMDKKAGSFLLSPGVRFFKRGQIEKASFDPRLNVRYSLGKNNDLKAAVGQYSKAPEGDQLHKVFGNPDLTYKVSNHYIAGWEKTWGEKWTTDFQLFRKTLKKAFRQDPVTRLNNKGSERIDGFEMFLRRNATARLFGWLSYTYSKNETRDDDDSEFQTSQYDQTHVLTLVGNYKISSTWDIGGRTTYHTGNPYTPVNDVVYNSNLDKYQRRTTQENKNSARLPGPTRVSIYATKDFLMDEWKLQMKFGVEEYLIGEEGIGLSYNYDFSEKTAVSGIPGIPYFELRAKL